MIVDLIESLKERTVPAANDDSKSEKSEKKVIVERVIERVPSEAPEKAKDWAPLLGDFDKRLDKMERQLQGQEQTNNRSKFSFSVTYKSQIYYS